MSNLFDDHHHNHHYHHHHQHQHHHHRWVAGNRPLSLWLFPFLPRLLLCLILVDDDMMMIWLWEDVKKWWWTLLMAYQWYYITQLQFWLSIRCWWYTGHPPCHFYLRRWKFIFYKENERESKAWSFTGMLKVHLGEASAIDLPFTYEVKNLRCSLKTLKGMFDFIRKYLKHEIF